MTDAPSSRPAQHRTLGKGNRFSRIIGSILTTRHPGGRTRPMELKSIEFEREPLDQRPGLQDERLTVKLQVVASSFKLDQHLRVPARELGERLATALGDSSYVQSAVIELGPTDVERLRRWLISPSGALTTDTDMFHFPRRGLVFNAVEDGSVWVRVAPR